MKELYSNADDCLKLARLLKDKLNRKIEFWGSTYQEVISGKYYSLPYEKYESYLEYESDEVVFSYKFLENGFLSISVSDSAYKNFSMGHKLAVLSDLYEVISEVYGNPTAFYTTKDDDENSINLEWDFIEKEETIVSFKNGTRFEDAIVDKLIVIDDEITAYNLNAKTKEMISKTIGLPFEMLPLIDENIDEFLSYKKGKIMYVPEKEKIKVKK